MTGKGYKQNMEIYVLYEQLLKHYMASNSHCPIDFHFFIGCRDGAGVLVGPMIYGTTQGKRGSTFLCFTFSWRLGGLLGCLEGLLRGLEGYLRDFESSRGPTEGSGGSSDGSGGPSEGSGGLQGEREKWRNVET